MPCLALPCERLPALFALCLCDCLCGCGLTLCCLWLVCTALIDRLSLNHIFLCGGIGHWMWKHLVGITPAAPGFARATIAPRIHDSVGPRSVGGRFLSPKGVISSSWAIGPGADTVRCENGSFLRHHLYCKPNICRNRLGTNIGNLKRVTCCLADSLCACQWASEAARSSCPSLRKLVNLLPLH